jgi:hypothetical protein
MGFVVEVERGGGELVMKVKIETGVVHLNEIDQHKRCRALGGNTQSTHVKR